MANLHVGFLGVLSFLKRGHVVGVKDVHRVLLP